jgi:uncharacterized membrane protein
MTLALDLLLFAGIGFVTGLRSMTAPAVVCWGAHLGWLHLDDSSLAFLGNPWTLVIFTLFAVCELIADKLPFIPRRTTPGPLAVRVILGALSASALCVTAERPLAYGMLLGVLGALAGAYAGYNYRRLIPAGRQVAQILAALAEDVVAVAGGICIVSRFL